MRLRYAALLLSMLAGCASTPEELDAPASSGTELKVVKEAPEAKAEPAKFSPSAQFTLRWDRSISSLSVSSDRAATPIAHPGMVRWLTHNRLTDMGSGVLRPALLGDAVYVADAGGTLLRLNAATGAQEWRVRTGSVITGGVGAGNGVVVVGSEKGEVLAYDEAGKLRWKAVVSSEVLGAPQVADGIVVVRSGDGRIAGLDVADGRRKWLHEHAMPALVVRNSAGVTIAGDTIYAGFAGGKLAAIDIANGGTRWEAILSEPRGNTELERISDITSAPQLDRDEVCAASFQGRVGCFSLKQGSMLWSKEMSSDKGLAISGNFVYVTNASGEVYALDRTNGSSAWKNSQLDKLHATAPAVLGNYLVVGDKEGYLYAIKREDGSLAARMRTDAGPLLTAPLPVGDGLLVQTFNGGLYFVTLN